MDWTPPLKYCAPIHLEESDLHEACHHSNNVVKIVLISFCQLRPLMNTMGQILKVYACTICHSLHTLFCTNTNFVQSKTLKVLCTISLYCLALSRSNFNAIIHI